MVVKDVVNRIAKIIAPRKKPIEIIDPNEGIRAIHSAWTEQQNAPASSWVNSGGRFSTGNWIRR